jgi:hypothetical protein
MTLPACHQLDAYDARDLSIDEACAPRAGSRPLMATVAFALALLSLPSIAFTAGREVRYAPAEAWVLPPPMPTATPDPLGAPLRVVYSDTQVRLTADGEEAYSSYRLKLLTSESLAAGNLNVSWNPDAADVTVHYLRIIREGSTINVLDTTKFQVIQRETELEQSTLSGMLTAILQVPGLRVRDEIEFAATVAQRDPTFGGRSSGFEQLPVASVPGVFRHRVIWPDSRQLRWWTTPDLKASPTRSATGQELLFELRDPQGVVETGGSSARYNMRRMIEFSDFGEWRDLSRLVFSLFDKAGQLAADSPVRAEARKIADATADPEQRARMALALVQDRIRYVFVGLDGGNYRPATADVTWERRYGDCKAKTVLLLALLKELGIQGEAVLVDPTGNDAAGQMLPTPALFNHVLVRAAVGGTSYWLDGTRAGDKTLDAIDAVPFRWALPLRAAGVALEPVVALPPRYPQSIQVIDIDATAGVDKPAKVRAQQVLRGEPVQQMRVQLATMSPDDASRALKSFFAQQSGGIQPDTAAWRYDETTAALVLQVAGTMPLDWDGDAAKGRSLSITGAGFTPPSRLIRPSEQDQSAPWLTEYPAFRCWVTTIRLPTPRTKWTWNFLSEPVNRRLGGVEYWRQASLASNIMRTVMSKRVVTPEITAADAAALNAAIPRFDNNVSQVFESNGSGKSVAVRPVPFRDDQDWAAPMTPCQATPP